MAKLPTEMDAMLRHAEQNGLCLWQMFDSKDNLIQTCFYYENCISEEEQAMCNRANRKIITDFSYISQNSSQIEIKMSIIRIDYPKKMPLIGHWVFYRKEDSSRYID